MKIRINEHIYKFSDCSMSYFTLYGQFNATGSVLPLIPLLITFKLGIFPLQVSHVGIEVAIQSDRSRMKEIIGLLTIKSSDRIFASRNSATVERCVMFLCFIFTINVHSKHYIPLLVEFGNLSHIFGAHKMFSYLRLSDSI